MKANTEILEMAKAVLKCTDEEMNIIQSNPKYMKMIEKAPELMNTHFVFEITEAHGCACQHRKGQKVIVNGDGSIMCRKSSAKVCVYLINSIIPIVYGAQEFIFAGMDPNELKFTRVGCFDTGARCGGLGHVALQFSSKESLE